MIPAAGGLERRLTDAPGPDGLPRCTPRRADVLFTSERTGNWQIYEVAADGGQAAPRARRTRTASGRSTPSPDGRRIAFLSNLDGAEQPVGAWTWRRRREPQ